MSVALKYPKSLWSYNPLPTGNLLYLPFWSPGLNGSAFKSVDPFGHSITVLGTTHDGDGRILDGDDNIALPSGVGLTPATGTIMFWVKFTRDNVEERLFSNNSNEILVRHTGANDIFFYYDSVAEANWAMASAVGNWVHLAFPYTQGGNALGYEDAVLKDTKAISATAPAEFQPTIGGHSDRVSTFFEGTFREFGMWNYPLSIEEISYHRRMTQR